VSIMREGNDMKRNDINEMMEIYSFYEENGGICSNMSKEKMKEK